MKKSIILLSMVLCMAIMAVGCSSFKEGFEAGLEAATKEEVSSEENTLEAEVKETVTETEVVAETEPVMEVETEEIAPVIETEVIVEETTAAEEAKPNILLEADVIVGDVMNGTKTEKLGEWAEIKIAKEILKSVPMEDFVAFCNEFVEGSGYNWVTISCEDGTGIQFQGSISYVATYGTLDYEGCIVDMIGTIMWDGEEEYSYTPVE